MRRVPNKRDKLPNSEKLRALVAENPELTVSRFAEMFGCTRPAVSMAFKKAGISVKRASRGPPRKLPEDTVLIEEMRSAKLPELARKYGVSVAAVCEHRKRLAPLSWPDIDGKPSLRRRIALALEQQKENGDALSDETPAN